LTIGTSTGNLWGTSTSGNNTIGGAGTYVEAAGTGESAGTGRGLAWTSGLRLVLTSAASRLVLVSCSGTLTCGTTAAVGVSLRKNGLDVSIAPVRLTAGASPSVFALSALLEMDDGDYVSPWLTNYDSTAGVTLASCRVSGLGVIA
jgi:hypothetical protein